MGCLVNRGVIVTVTCVFVCAATACLAQTTRTTDDGYRVRMLIEQIDSLHWEAVVELENAGPIAALTLPLSYGNGRSPFRVDSATYRGLRTEYFALKTFRIDSTKQSVLIGLISDLGGNYPPLEPGSGAIALLHLSTRKMATQVPRLDTTFIAPHNTLQLVSPDVRAIRPQFVPAHAGHELK